MRGGSVIIRLKQVGGVIRTKRFLPVITVLRVRVEEAAEKEKKQHQPATYQREYYSQKYQQPLSCLPWDI